MPLPEISFYLHSDTGLENISQFGQLTEKLERMSRGVGKNSDVFKLRLRELYEVAKRGDDVIGAIQIGRDIRAVIHLWLHFGPFLELAPLTQSFLDRFRLIRQKQSLPALYELVLLFFLKFDQLSDIEALSGFLIQEFENFGDKVLWGDMLQLRGNAERIFLIEGPFFVVNYAQDRDVDLQGASRQLGIPQEADGRYLQICKNHYFLETIRNLIPGETHEVFDEVVKTDVKQSTYQDGLWLGHAVIKVMIDRVVEVDMNIPESWRPIILQIAGDPRVPTHSRNYLDWWSLIGEPYLSHMRRWLSRFDFRLFLEVLDEYAKRSHNDGLQRMFPKRKTFIEGLFEQDLIHDSRLFISNNADYYLRMSYKRENLPKYARLRDADKSVIYLNVGGCHIIEGTHSFSIWIYDELPEKNPATNYSIQKVAPHDLGPGLAQLYHRERGEKGFWSGYDTPTRIVHHPNITWQHKVMESLANNRVFVNPEKVFDRKDYDIYKRYHGIPWWLSRSDRNTYQTQKTPDQNRHIPKPSLIKNQENERQIQRPYLSKSSLELEDIFKRNLNNVTELMLIHKELGSRKSNIAVQLKEKVRQRIHEFGITVS